MARVKSATQFLMIGWLAIFLACVVSADLVVDMGFESMDFSSDFGAAPVSEETDNSAEHVLLPSYKADPAGNFISYPSVSPVETTFFLLPHHLFEIIGCPRQPINKFASPRGPSFLLSLRI